ncbi:DUF4212 domain-containing protein [Pseudalkalibacillus caeni]|uniref:DUF4212 domain-containing protein n=1 Tax=Exobacillus caeni TaxID=2574798 RepID=A0A5R9F2Q3_9BACL|nr:sodium/substrate symporter small subunit [Pseudalkalibacillus caeni]TLS35808.1 DUF4212 domain-containing protein [Pseudalkalibacillus caeni]
MKKIDKAVADAYFKERIRLIGILLVIWFIVSYVMVFFAESLAQYSFNGFPLHYFMGAQGSVATFIVLLFVNAAISDRIDEKYGLSPKKKIEQTLDRSVNQ